MLKVMNTSMKVPLLLFAAVTLHGQCILLDGKWVGIPGREGRWPQMSQMSPCSKVRLIVKTF